MSELSYAAEVKAWIATLEAYPGIVGQLLDARAAYERKLAKAKAAEEDAKLARQMSESLGFPQGWPRQAGLRKSHGTRQA